MLLHTLLTLSITLAVTGVSAQETACLPGVRFDDGGASCLSLIRQKAQDTSAFPFSTPFSTFCSPERPDSMTCFVTPERLPLDQPYSLSMLVFGAQCQEDPLTGLDRYLSVNYVSPPGDVTGCDVTQHLDRIELELSPLSDFTCTTWAVRQEPIIHWQAESDELFTLLLADIESQVLHAAYVNIRGNDLTNSLVLREYLAPGNMRPNPRVYTFLLYKQSAPIFSEPLPGCNFNVTSLVQRHNLQGPVGINWMVVGADVNSMRNARSFFGLQNCAYLVERELEKNNPDLPFLSKPYNLKLNLRVRFTTEPFTYKCGPLSISHPGSDFYLDPIGNPILNVADVSNESILALDLEKNNISPNNKLDFAGKLYTMLIVDDGPPFLHGLTINIHGDNVYQRTVVLPYRQPGPSSVQTYYFLLFEQKEEISLAATAGFTQTTCPNNRCLYGIIQAFISLNDLELAGVTWMRADNDDYVRCSRL